MGSTAIFIREPVIEPRIQTIQAIPALQVAPNRAGGTIAFGEVTNHFKVGAH